MNHLRLILPFPRNWTPDLSDEAALPDYLRAALPIAQKRIPNAVLPEVIQHSNAFIFSLDDIEPLEKAFLMALEAIGGYGFIEPLAADRDMMHSWVCAISQSEAIVVQRKNSWSL